MAERIGVQWPLWCAWLLVLIWLLTCPRLLSIISGVVLIFALSMHPIALSNDTVADPYSQFS